MNYTLIRSRRKTLAVEINRSAEVIVRAPLHLPQREIDRFLQAKQRWIASSLERQRLRCAAHPEPDEAQWARLKELALAYLPDRVAFYAGQMGVFPSAVRFSRASTRFGSCSAKNSITFSLRLLEYPPAAIDYVVVHELAHIRYKNHGRDFYRFVASVLPDYREREKLLRA